MSYDWKVRITLPFQDCSGIILSWFDRCSTAVCYEHTSDEDIKQTHVHLALFGCEVKVEALKRMWADAPGKGNEFWSLTPADQPQRYLVYMAKGKLTPKLVKNISPAELEQHQKSWVEPSLGNDKPKDASEYMILKVLDKFNYKSFDDFRQAYTHSKYKESSTVYHGADDYCNWLLNEVRSVTMRVFWGENRRVPHATQYKIVAGSVFLRICENLNLFETGINTMKNLWY